MRKKPNEKVVRKPELAKAISDILEGFGLVRSRPRTGKAHKVVEVIFKVIFDALWQGDSIRIAGFGSFDSYIRPPLGRRIAYFQGGQALTPNPVRTYSLTPSKRIVRFTPSKVLLRQLNQGETTHEHENQ